MDEKQRIALFHIPIEKGEIAGDPFLVRNMNGSQSNQCFGDSVTTCGHLTIGYVGEIGKLKWRNHKTESLKLRKRCEGEWSDDDDFVEKRQRR